MGQAGDHVGNFNFKVEIEGVSHKIFPKVEGNPAQQVGGNQSFKVEGNPAQQVGGNQDFKVEGNPAQQVGGNQDYKVTGSSAQKVGGSQNFKVEGNPAGGASGKMGKFDGIEGSVASNPGGGGSPNPAAAMFTGGDSGPLPPHQADVVKMPGPPAPHVPSAPDGQPDIAKFVPGSSAGGSTPGVGPHGEGLGSAGASSQPSPNKFPSSDDLGDESAHKV